MGLSYVIGAAASLTVVVGSALGVTAIPVGPVDPTRQPLALNDRGDVLFYLQRLNPSNYMLDISLELIRAGGERTTFADPSLSHVPSRSLTSDGRFLVWLVNEEQSHPLPGGGVAARYSTELIGPDGSRAPIPAPGVDGRAFRITPDGRALGISWDVAGGSVRDVPTQPFVWNQQGDLLELQFPLGHDSAIASYGTSDKRYVGFAGAKWYDSEGLCVWWNSAGEVESTFDLDELQRFGVSRFISAGVRGDGTLIGYQDGQIVAITPDAGARVIETEPSEFVRVDDVNAAGYMIGTRGLNDGPWQQVIWAPDGTCTPLDDFLPPELGRYVGYVMDINDRGDVLVQTSVGYASGMQQAYVITGIPAPGAPALLMLGATFGTARRRRAAIGALACLAGAASGASAGVTITPVGPAGLTHYPRALNERGDVVFDVDWGAEFGWAAGNTLSGPELVRADGTAQRFTTPGADFGYSVALGEDGSVVGQYAFRFPGTEGYDTFKWKSAVKSADGADVMYTGPSPFACFNGVTLDGAYFGSGSNPEYLGAYDPASPRYPIAWDPVDGETLLRLPQECIAGEAQFGNPAGGYVGWAYTEELMQQYLWWDATGDVTGSISMDAVEAIHEGGLISFGGVRGDGAIIGAINHRLMELRADGTIKTFGALYDGEAILEDVNAQGLAVGITYEFGDALSHPRAVVWSPEGQTLELQSLLPSDSPWVLTSAVDITESGDILVHALLREDDSIGQAFIIRGVPTPGGVVIAGCAGAMVVAYGRRR